MKILQVVYNVVVMSYLFQLTMAQKVWEVRMTDGTLAGAPNYIQPPPASCTTNLTNEEGHGTCKGNRQGPVAEDNCW